MTPPESCWGSEVIMGRKQITSKKSKILAKARKLFWEKGYQKITMRDIARACGFEPSNLYNYFPNKETLLYEVIMEEMDLLLSSIRQLEYDRKTGPVEQLQSLIRSHVDSTLRYRQRIGLFESELRHFSSAKQKMLLAMGREYDQILQRIIRRGIETGDFAEVDVKLTGYSIASMIVRTGLWYSPRGRLSRNEIADGLLKFALHGILAKKPE